MTLKGSASPRKDHKKKHLENFELKEELKKKNMIAR